ncbi:hypothetical protein [Actinophytocola algeriensis]|uniref:PPE family protein n=1 Tax=Actinophytocola algeriensis TaxID=1768010 RepID=A0A7W7VDW4_9PSEU|nr:hypothetical protein [Actinophytocola algeriensis]MBB4906420.1 hypothetical protein [Actinophytocola algeriensis]MBE1477901.1 hypothetical protein [Actinophytocola algeriensis]
MLDYTKIDLDTQLAHIASELPSVNLLAQKAAMWTTAGSALSTASQNFATQNRTLAPDWTDHLGERWLGTAEASQRTLDTWDENVNGSNPSTDLQAVAAQIPPTHETVLKFKQIADALKALASNPLVGAAVQQIILQLQQAAGALMNKLAKDYATAGDKVATAGSGGQWEGLQGGSTASVTYSTEDGEVTRSASVGEGSVSVSSGGVGDLPGQDGSAAGGSDLDTGEESDVDTLAPELSGGGGLAPPSAPPVSPPPSVAPPTPVAGAQAGMPFAPMAGGFGRGGGVSGGGVRMPSVAAPRPTHIPVAAAPVNPLTAPSPAAAPTAPQPLVPPPATVTGTAGMGGVPPMMPMMGGAGMGVGGSTAGVGAGLGRRPVRVHDDEDTPTPGLPAVLTGKTAVADPFTLATRRVSVAPDAPATVEFIDEDQWQAERQRAGAEQEVR